MKLQGLQGLGDALLLVNEALANLILWLCCFHHGNVFGGSFELYTLLNNSLNKNWIITFVAFKGLPLETMHNSLVCRYQVYFSSDLDKV